MTRISTYYVLIFCRFQSVSLYKKEVKQFATTHFFKLFCQNQNFQTLFSTSHKKDQMSGIQVQELKRS